ncbi:vacuolar iron transporter homolog 1-like isoform X2 [Cryptomeria japonica]|uniref:vacuolar iron transporter homolog 1-like isoform X2 n=1 Tax=Cryptomeria japonica TaxID=3369 RepID=UPI0027DA9B57|nr:vacuolar iron transporter homolog 1-like isoform X2 [Cryptomeria japonica]
MDERASTPSPSQNSMEPNRKMVEEGVSASQNSVESKRKMVEEGVAVADGSPFPKSQNPSVVVTMSSSSPKNEDEMNMDFQNRAQWLRAAVLGANDGLVTTASLMMGVGAVKTDAKTMVMSGLAALVAGACSMGIGEFVSVQTQRDAEISILKEEKKAKKTEEKEGLPSPIQAACASALAFSVGAFFPLISAAFVKDYVNRVGVLSGVSSLTLLMFGATGAYFGRSSIVKGSVRVLIGGWLAMLVTYGLLRLFRATAGV